MDDCCDEDASDEDDSEDDKTGSLLALTAEDSDAILDSLASEADDVLCAELALDGTSELTDELVCASTEALLSDEPGDELLGTTTTTLDALLEGSAGEEDSTPDEFSLEDSILEDSALENSVLDSALDFSLEDSLAAEVDAGEDAPTDTAALDTELSDAWLVLAAELPGSALGLSPPPPPPQPLNTNSRHHSHTGLAPNFPNRFVCFILVFSQPYHYLLSEFIFTGRVNRAAQHQSVAPYNPGQSPPGWYRCSQRRCTNTGYRAYCSPLNWPPHRWPAEYYPRHWQARHNARCCWLL